MVVALTLYDWQAAHILLIYSLFFNLTKQKTAVFLIYSFNGCPQFICMWEQWSRILDKKKPYCYKKLEFWRVWEVYQEGAYTFWIKEHSACQCGIQSRQNRAINFAANVCKLLVKSFISISNCLSLVCSCQYSAFILFSMHIFFLQVFCILL